MPKILKRLVFIDIEGTIVDDWFSFNALPDNIEAILDYFEPLDTVCLFTYAVFDKDKELKGTHRLGVIARDLLHKPYLMENMQYVFTKKDAMDTIYNSKDVVYDVYAEINFNEKFSKQRAFLEMIRKDERFHDCECVLIDDMNKDVCIVEFPKTNLRITYETLEHIKELQNARKDIP